MKEENRKKLNKKENIKRRDRKRGEKHSITKEKKNSE